MPKIIVTKPYHAKYGKKRISLNIVTNHTIMLNMVTKHIIMLNIVALTCEYIASIILSGKYF